MAGQVQRNKRGLKVGAGGGVSPSQEAGTAPPFHPGHPQGKCWEVPDLLLRASPPRALHPPLPSPTPWAPWLPLTHPPPAPWAPGLSGSGKPSEPGGWAGRQHFHPGELCTPQGGLLTHKACSGLRHPPSQAPSFHFNVLIPPTARPAPCETGINKRWALREWAGVSTLEGAWEAHVGQWQGA